MTHRDEVQPTKPYKVANTEILKELNNLAIETKGHRSVVDKFFDDVDPYGRHVVVRSWPYGQNMNGPCARVEIICKMRSDRGSMKVGGYSAEKIMMDLPFGTVRRLGDDYEPPPTLLDF